MPKSRLLILGGTTEAKDFARLLTQQIPSTRLQVFYAQAGRLGESQLAKVNRQLGSEIEVVSGGFSRFETSEQSGLTVFCDQQQIAVTVDLSHPFAEQISAQASATAVELDLKYWRYQRPSWQPEAGDNWCEYASLSELEQALNHYQRPFLSLGQSSYDIATNAALSYLIRSVSQAPSGINSNITHLQAQGPFSLEAEIALLQQQSIDVLVSKHSGGVCENKLIAARELGLPVLLLARPKPAPAERVFSDLDSLLAHCQTTF